MATSPPVVLIAEELAPSVLEVLGTDVEIRHVDAVMIRSATRIGAREAHAADLDTL